MKNKYLKKSWTSILCIFIISLILINLTSGVVKVNAAITASEEFRGVWVATVFNNDWPSKSGLSVAAQKSEYMARMDEVKSMNFNSVIFQVRAMGDAFYPSSYSPWSKYLSGSLGVNPGYDPLAFAVDEAHKRGLDFHAWFNPFRISSEAGFSKDDYISKLPSTSPLKANPQWIVSYGNLTWINPGIPEARKYVIDTIMEVVNKYNIEGVHLDDYFYPYPGNNGEFPDDNEFAQYGAGYASKGDWRRDNVNKFVKDLSDSIKKVKPSVKFGISPFGIWKNGVSNGGSNTNGLSSYDVIYTDSLKWAKEQWVDYIIPQIYWSIGFSKADYKTLVDWWSTQLKDVSTNLYIGQAAYKVGNSDYYYEGGWDNENQIRDQIAYNRQNGKVKGQCLFSLKDINNNPLGLKDKLKNEIYAAGSDVPYVPGNIKLNSFTSSSMSPKIYDKITFTANATGDKALLYRFSLAVGDNWQVVQNYSSTNSFSWFANAIGDYKVKVDVKSEKSTQDSEASNIISYRVSGLNKVFIDPGHGGRDSGAVGASEQTYEKNNTLSTSFKLKSLLEAYGLEVMMSRTDDTYVELIDRANMANNWNADIFISVHNNSADPVRNADGSIKYYPYGIETFSYSTTGEGANLAGKVQSRLIADTGFANRGTKTANFSVLRNTNMPAILVELGFISNPNEEKLIGSDSFQSLLAKSISSGVRDYYNLSYYEDINKDNKIDIQDLATVASGYNKSSGQAGWNSACDLNKDGVIDLYDLTMIAKKLQ